MESNLEHTGASARASRRAVLGAAVVGTVWSAPVVKAAADTPAKSASSPEQPPVDIAPSVSHFGAWAARGGFDGNFGVIVKWPAVIATFTVVIIAAPVGGGPSITQTFTQSGLLHYQDTFSFRDLTPGDQYTVTLTATIVLTSYRADNNSTTVTGSWTVEPLTAGPVTVTVPSW